jgi:hypothetical protein
VPSPDLRIGVAFVALDADPRSFTVRDGTIVKDELGALVRVTGFSAVFRMGVLYAGRGRVSLVTAGQGGRGSVLYPALHAALHAAMHAALHAAMHAALYGAGGAASVAPPDGLSRGLGHHQALHRGCARARAYLRGHGRAMLCPDTASGMRYTL